MRAVLGSWTVPPSPETNSPKSYLWLAVVAYWVVILRSIVSDVELQASPFKTLTALTIVTTSLAVQEFRLEGHVADGNGTGLMAAPASAGTNRPPTMALNARPIAARPNWRGKDALLQYCFFRPPCALNISVPLSFRWLPFPQDAPR
jgi:hypothetical protein